jgi:putative RNA 2'-phosphotransferase
MHATPSNTASDFAFLLLCGHVPSTGLRIDAEGWAEVPYVLRALKAEGHILSRFAFERLVAADPARRFVLSADRHRIRAIPQQPVEPITSAGMAAAK